MDNAKLLIEVTAGVLPPEVKLSEPRSTNPEALPVSTGWTRNRPEPEFTRRWAITSSEWDEAGDSVDVLLAARNGEAMGYAQLLMLQPSRFNHVRVDWIWL